MEHQFWNSKWFLLYLLHGIHLLWLTSGLESAVNEADKLALLDFKQRITEDPLQIMNSWNDSVHFCNWVGVTCNPSNGRVIDLNLELRQLLGSIPPSIGNLTYLTGINLRRNGFHGEVPQEIGRLQQLQDLNITFNYFSGKIPTNLSECTELRVLEASANQFVGQIPDLLRSLTKLEILGLGRNNLTGNIPAWLGNFSSLQVLRLLLNNFQGSIPNEVGQLSGLGVFQLYGNSLSGMIPSSIYNISSIYYFSVTQNQLQGQLPSDVGLTLPNLNIFAGGVNYFTGSIPVSLSNASNLQLVDFAENGITGTIPRSFGSLKGLFRLNLDINKLGNREIGDLNFLTFLANCTSLEVLGLAQNRFGGELPSSIANLSTHLQILTLGSNLIHGNIPVGIGNLVNLSLLGLEYNNLGGRVPDVIGKLQKLEGLELSGNKFSGLIPAALGNLTTLTRLLMDNNKFEGSIPPNLGICQKLEVLNLSSNKLSGIIPKQVMGLSSLSISLVMSHNFLTGSLPLEVDISRSTDNFSETNLIGSGSFGSVYRGILVGGTIVAIKVLKLQQPGALKSFIDECNALKNIRHRNILRTITACSSVDHEGNDFKCLVFEYMSNGCLDQWLHPSAEEHNHIKKLSLMQRLNIAIDVASALDYLHHYCETPIAHCDLKPSNVLLDEDMTAHVGDFGLAKFLFEASNSSTKNHPMSIGLKGSIGYIPPEYMNGHVSILGDIYSFGILLLEMFTGKRPTDDMFKDDLSIHKFVSMAFPVHVMEIIDPLMIFEEENSDENDEHGIEEKAVNTDIDSQVQKRRKMEECLVSVMKIGLMCSTASPRERRAMNDVVNNLHGIRDSFLRFQRKGKYEQKEKT
ncbi:putative Receptor-kinase [Melia azedarach]|uniref:Receptor-kinase n=1 Tax=Melia azedarach TaxID=155640 RepID=A0ACC1WUM7_MELAZ|nr:putative Receptor-kinase [Melia azedarach]